MNTTYQSAITEADGVSVNVGYLSLHRLLTLDVCISVTLVAAGFVQQYFAADHHYPFEPVGVALGAAWGTFSTALAALGLFLWGDRRPG